MALTTTVGGSASDSYVTVAAADTYIHGSGYATEQEWVILAEGHKERALKLSALVLNMFPYRGAKACREQRLEFPRWWRTDDNYPSSEDDYLTYADCPVPAPTVPQEVKDAQCEIAFQVFCQTVFKSEVMAFPEMGLKSFSLGGAISLTFDSAMGSVGLLNKSRTTSALIIQSLLWKWVRSTGGGVV